MKKLNEKAQGIRHANLFTRPSLDKYEMMLNVYEGNAT
jgi:hypothetical protein